ncbi:MAG: GntR family transcriptional regulator [Casimicrobiaceae bacterium]
MTALATLGHRTMALAAADELRRRITNGDFPDGFQLKQDALAEDFGMSRIPIREALVQLESEGFVRILPHRGALVSELSPADIRELFELRALLEPRLLRLSAPRLTAADYATLDAINAEYRAEIRAMNRARWGELNTRLHLHLVSKAEQPRTLAIVTALLQNTDRYTRLQLSLTGSGRTRAEKEHVTLVRLCRTGNVNGACELLASHIANAEAMLIAFIKARGGRERQLRKMK